MRHIHYGHLWYRVGWVQAGVWILEVWLSHSWWVLFLLLFASWALLILILWVCSAGVQRLLKEMVPAMKVSLLTADSSNRDLNIQRM
jgi:hypothetical protein